MKHVTMYNAAPAHDWIFNSYHMSPCGFTQIADELHANGYSYIIEDDRIVVDKDNSLIAVIQ